MGMEKTKSSSDISSKLAERYIETGNTVKELVSGLQKDKLSLKESKAATLKEEIRDLKKLQEKIMKAGKVDKSNFGFHVDGLMESLAQQEKDKLNKLSGDEFYYGKKREGMGSVENVLKNMKKRLKKEIQIALEFERKGTSRQAFYEKTKMILEMGIGCLAFGLVFTADAKQLTPLIGGDVEASGVMGIVMGSLTSLISGVQFGLMKFERWAKERKIYEAYTNSD
ncbi:MAG: hypothetical protein KGH61_00275 [Candidatus Micrarchaeota archaeon]|nr:hypothetical protein [Candidatus Micrarchaeota archaeon]MDE1847372.1 hypothetical protein [Candidatus Micrarchaeota archaeon]MDE1863987.1 hypothetical protein [Candidatus Micrarchaeota archaeon]